jgi:N-methylhydantoinase B
MKRAKADAVLTEIVRNGVIAVTEEMKTNLMRTAYNMIVYEALDFTVGLYTAEGDTVSIGLGLPSFIRGMAETVKAKLKHFGKEGLEPGDILVTNDAYTTGSHLYHFTFSLPIFHRASCRDSPAAWRTGPTSEGCSAASPPTYIPRASRSRS